MMCREAYEAVGGYRRAFYLFCPGRGALVAPSGEPAGVCGVPRQLR